MKSLMEIQKLMTIATYAVHDRCLKVIENDLKAHIVDISNEDVDKIQNITTAMNLVWRPRLGPGPEFARGRGWCRGRGQNSPGTGTGA